MYCMSNNPPNAFVYISVISIKFSHVLLFYRGPGTSGVRNNRLSKSKTSVVETVTEEKVCISTANYGSSYCL